MVSEQGAQNAQPVVQASTAEQASTNPADASTSTISTDFTLPVTLRSRDQALDGINKTSIFTENVTIRQGSLELLADRVEIDAANGPGREIIMASGQPSSYQQRKDDGTMVQASANQITYDVSTRTISLKGNALITQDGVRVTGDAIVFDMSKEQILASTSDDSDNSVTTVISPGSFSTPEKSEQEKQQEQPPEVQP
ncbi:lipopolysaccharide transport periplasmic protein LptA [Glaciecola sp. XM2]|jgi:lipopolysaccharide export system protein LptA|nr:lipopolysaccharide transport periplasmic protein LptA [Glaciecola sp. XM2]